MADSSPARLERVLAALQAATLSFLLTTFWCGFASATSGHSFWTFPNLTSGLLLGSASLRPDFGFHTLTGLSLYFLFTAGPALLYALLISPNLRPTVSLLLGVLGCTWWFYLLDGFFWRKTFSPLSLYARRPSIFFSFILMGICVGLYSVFVRPSQEAQVSA
jgi:hypothetical protein